MGEEGGMLPGWSALPTAHTISCFASVSESPRYLPWRATDCSTQSCQDGLATAQKSRHKDAARLPDEKGKRNELNLHALTKKRAFMKCMTHFRSATFEVRVWQLQKPPEYRASGVCTSRIVSLTSH